MKASSHTPTAWARGSWKDPCPWGGGGGYRHQWDLRSKNHSLEQQEHIKDS